MSSAPNGGEGTSFPLAAQIPLKEFTLPEFPAEGSRLRELTLTADIKLDEYQNMVQTHEDALVTQGELPKLPQSITHLTFELFGLGFPGTPPFLTRIARALPNVKSVTFFSCLIDGLDNASRRDAEKFFECLPHLQELHVIDSFARPGFFKSIGAIFEARAKANSAGEGEGDGLKLVNVSYTFRGHEDSDFLARVQGEELSGLIVKGMVGASFDFVPERVDDLAEAAEGEDGKNENDNKEKEKEKVAEGVLPFASDGRAPTAVRKRFETMSTADGQLRSLKVLNLGMWTLRAPEVAEVVYACAGGGGGTSLVDLTISVLLEDGWADKLAEALQEHKSNGKDIASALEGIEVIGVPDRAAGNEDEGEEVEDENENENENDTAAKATHDLKVISQAEVERIAAACPKLGKFGMSILKVKSAPNVVFMKEQGQQWTRR